MRQQEFKDKIEELIVEFNNANNNLKAIDDRIEQYKNNPAIVIDTIIKNIDKGETLYKDKLEDLKEVLTAIKSPLSYNIGFEKGSSILNESKIAYKKDIEDFVDGVDMTGVVMGVLSQINNIKESYDPSILINSKNTMTNNENIRSNALFNATKYFTSTLRSALITRYKPHEAIKNLSSIVKMMFNYREEWSGFNLKLLSVFKDYVSTRSEDKKKELLEFIESEHTIPETDLDSMVNTLVNSVTNKKLDTEPSSIEIISYTSNLIDSINIAYQRLSEYIELLRKDNGYGSINLLSLDMEYLVKYVKENPTEFEIVLRYIECWYRSLFSLLADSELMYFIYKLTEGLCGEITLKK